MVRLKDALRRRLEKAQGGPVPAGEVTEQAPAVDWRDPPVYLLETPVDHALVGPAGAITCENGHFQHESPGPAAVYLAALAPGSRRTMLAALRTLATLLGQVDPLTCPWHQLRYQHAAALRSRLAERYAPATANRHLAALRGVLQEARRLGLMSADECAAACDVPPVRGKRLPKGRALDAPEIAAVLTACADGSPAGARDAALLAVAYGGGLRRAELVGLDLVDWRAADAEVRVRHGKGDKERVVYLGEDWAALLEAWLAVRGRHPGPIFAPIAKAGRVLGRRLAASTVRQIFLARGEQAGVERFSPHDLRRTMISHLLDAGEDLSTVQQVAGHANVVTTARYDRRGEQAKRRAAQRLRRG